MTITLLVVLIVLVITNGYASPALQRRAPAITAPSGWKVSWTRSARVSNGASTNFISLFTVDATASDVAQSHVQTCVDHCSTTSSCAFVNLVKLTGSSKGNVVCMLFPHYVQSGQATYTTGPQSSGGAVDYSYGIRSLCAPTNGGAPTCIPSSSSGGSGNSGGANGGSSSGSHPAAQPWHYPSDSSLPAAPQGATLIEWPPCSSSLSVPAMANQAALHGSSASAAYVVQHGTGSDFDAYFTALYNVLGNSYPILSPGFLTDDYSSAYYRRGVNLVWGAGIDTWAVGQDDTTGTSCSSFDMYDAIINYYANSGMFTNLQTIYFVGHSGGGNMVSRFSTINSNKPKAMKYVVANAANQGYFSNARPVASSSCDAAFVYPYQWASGSYPRYVGNRVGGRSAQSLFTSWASTNVVHLTGDGDTDTGGTQTCASTAQGGGYRRDRNYAYWAYINILGGTSSDVSQYTGYAELKREGAHAIASGSSFNHRECTVSGVGHDQNAIFASACGRGAIVPGQSLPSGAGASYP